MQNKFEGLAWDYPLGVGALLVFCLNWPVQGPMIQADEGSYLANAAVLAGFPNDLASSYYAGYSFAQLAFVPAFLIMFAVSLCIIEGKACAWLDFGVVAGFLYWIHPTGIAPIIAVCIACA